MQTEPRGGSAGQFETLYVSYHSQVFGYVRRRCEHAKDAADVIAETFLVAWRQLEDVPREDDVRPWLYGITRRVLLYQRRGARRGSALAQRLQADLAPPMPLAVRDGTGDDTELLLRDVLSGLSVGDQEVLKPKHGRVWHYLR